MRRKRHHRYKRLSGDDIKRAVLWVTAIGVVVMLIIWSM